MTEQPFVIEPPGDLAVATALAVRAAHQWALPEPVLIRLGMNALYSAGDEVVIRVGRPTSDPMGALRLARSLAVHGIRTPRYVRDEPIMAGDMAGGLAAVAIASEPHIGAIDWVEVGAMVACLHSLDFAEIATFYPVPRSSTFPWWQFDRLLAEVDDLLDGSSRAGIIRAMRRHQPSLDSDSAPSVLCHGDVHPGNVLSTSDGPMLIDWDLLCSGPRGWDHGPLMTWTERWGGEPGIYARFAEGYGDSMRGDPVAEAVAELRLVAATLMRLRAGRADVQAAAEAELRLRYWRGDVDAPAWHAA